MEQFTKCSNCGKDILKTMKKIVYGDSKYFCNGNCWTEFVYKEFPSDKDI